MQLPSCETASVRHIYDMSLRFSSTILACCIALLCGCQSPNLEKRISNNQEYFNSWPLEVQESILNGEIQVGFTREQVEMAWGKPDNKTVETTSQGTVELWWYEKSSPSFGIGLGVGSFGSRTGVGGGVGTTVGGKTNVLALVRFTQGEVISFERADNK